MAERFRIPAIPFLGSLSRRDADASPYTDLEVEVVQLFDGMRSRILRYALSFGLPVPDAEEVVQDVFLALYQHLSQGKPRNALCGWLFRVTHNLSLKRRTALSRTPSEPMSRDGEFLPVADPRPNPEDQMAFRQRQDRLRSVVAALPEMDRECLYLRSEGLRYREIAEVLGIALGSVANSLARSLSRLAAADERLG
jgi:RNA polymerase sigma-70 factor (ECF subfamily)